MCPESTMAVSSAVVAFRVFRTGLCAPVRSGQGGRSLKDAMLAQMIRAGRLDRPFYESLLFDNYATGNAVVMIIIAGILPQLWPFWLVGAAFAILSSILRAVLVSAAVWAASVHIFKRYGDYRATFRMVGFANVAFLPLVLAGRPGALGLVALLVAGVWFFLALRTVVGAQFDLAHPENSFVAATGLLGWYLSIILF